MHLNAPKPGPDLFSSFLFRNKILHLPPPFGDILLYLLYKPLIVEDIKQRLTQIMEAADWSAEDRKWLLEYLEKNDTSELRQLMNENFTTNLENGGSINKETAKHILSQIHKRIYSGGFKIRRIWGWSRVAAAAAVLVVILGTYLLFIDKSGKESQFLTNKPVQPADIVPGGNKAVLTLSDGSVVILDNAQNGILSQQGSTKVLKLNDGQLAYNANGSPLGNGGKVLYNTISTPRGGQYQMTLSDGTKIWMNAASSVRFPVTFSSTERRVELTGEAYFEVAKNTTKPFRVKTSRQEVEVLGTHFNINAYTDETTINTTLLEGKVKVTDAGEKSVVIIPGQQARLGKQLTVTDDIDTDEIVAWKEGLFSFKGADIQTIMRQVARWYDVEVVFEGKVPDKKYRGKISREINASQVLRILEESGAKFRIEGKKIIVSG